MSKAPHQQEAQRIQRQRQDMARALPFLGVFLLVSPILNTLIGIETILGAPIAYLYIFVAWAFLILATARLSGRLTGQNGKDS